MNRRSLGEIFAKAFLIFLPFRMLALLAPATRILGAQAEHFSLVFHALGMLVCLTKERDLLRTEKRGPDSLLYIMLRMVAVFAVISLIMAIIINFSYGRQNGNSPFVAVGKMLLDFLQYALIMMYTKAVFAHLGHRGVIKCLIIATRLALIVGYMQIAKLKGVPVITQVYDFLAKIFAFNSFRNQIALTLWEPSWAAMFIGAVVLPLHMTRMITKYDNPSEAALELLLWIPAIVMTKSTTAYLLTFAAFGAAVLIILFSRTNNRGIRALAVFLTLVGILLLNNLDTVDNALGFNFSYLFRSKLTDLRNQSTASRMVPLIGNWYIFLRFPLFGCGNGLQGYFYKTLIPRELIKGLYFDKAITDLLNGRTASIANGQLFFPAILSGYGLVGAVLMARFIAKSVNWIRFNRENYGFFGTMFLIALIPIIISGFKSEFVGNYYIWFMLSLPFAAFRRGMRYQGGLHYDS